MKFDKLEDAIERGIIDHCRACPRGSFHIESSSTGGRYSHYYIDCYNRLNILELVPAIAARLEKLAKESEN